jgi:L-lactate dehydrogenase complex protein LldG
MSSDREKIFSAIRSALDPLPNRAARPDWDDTLIVRRTPGTHEKLVSRFCQKLQAAAGWWCESPAELRSLLEAEQNLFGYCDPKLSYLFEELAGVSFDTEFDLAKVDAYTFGITKATAAIAESGTLVFRDQDTSSRLGALAPWVHIAVVDRFDIVATIGEAIARFGDDPSIIFATGPSKTADVEGILIEGVHGPGVQVAYLL